MKHDLIQGNKIQFVPYTTPDAVALGSTLTPADTGLEIYNSDTKNKWIWDGLVWFHSPETSLTESFRGVTATNILLQNIPVAITNVTINRINYSHDDYSLVGAILTPSTPFVSDDIDVSYTY
jgi:hypothetical protein